MQVVKVLHCSTSYFFLYLKNDSKCKKTPCKSYHHLLVEANLIIIFELCLSHVFCPLHGSYLSKQVCANLNFKYSCITLINVKFAKHFWDACTYCIFPSSYPLEGEQSSFGLFSHWMCKFSVSMYQFVVQLNQLFFLVCIWQGHIEQWIDFATLEVDMNILRWYVPRAGWVPYLAPVSMIFPSPVHIILKTWLDSLIYVNCVLL